MNRAILFTGILVALIISIIVIVVVIRRRRETYRNLMCNQDKLHKISDPYYSSDRINMGAVYKTPTELTPFEGSN